MRVFFDTNVLLAALLTRGTCGLVLEHCWKHHDVFFSGLVLEEFRRKALGKLKAPPGEIGDRVRFFREYGNVVREPEEIRTWCRDPQDDRILAAALSSRADGLVSGDKDLLALAPRFPVPIIAPGAFFAFENDFYA